MDVRAILESYGHDVIGELVSFRLRGDFIPSDFPALEKLIDDGIVEIMYEGTCPVCGLRQIQSEREMECVECGSIFVSTAEVYTLSNDFYVSLRDALALKKDRYEVIPLTLSPPNPERGRIKLFISPVIEIESVKEIHGHFGVIGIPWEMVYDVLDGSIFAVVDEIIEKKIETTLSSCTTSCLKRLVYTYIESRYRAKIHRDTALIHGKKYMLAFPDEADERYLRLYAMRFKRLGYAGCFVFLHTDKMVESEYKKVEAITLAHLREWGFKNTWSFFRALIDK